MKYFKDGLTKSELKKAYYNLAKENHPDVGGSELVMKEINAEYDTYFTRVETSSTSNYSWETWNDVYESARKEAEQSREFIVFMMKNERKPGQFIGIDREFVAGHYSFFDFFFGGSGRNSHYVRKFYFPDKSWTDVHEGLAKIEIVKDNGKNCYVVKGRNLVISCPSYEEMADYVIKHNLVNRYYFGNIYHSDMVIYVENNIGKFYLSGDKSKLYAKIDNKLVATDVNPEQFKDVSSENSGTYYDFPFLASIDCTFSEFSESTYVGWMSEFYQALQMNQRRDADFSYSGLIVHMVKKGIINIHESRMDRTLRYATFDPYELAVAMKNLDADDVNEMVEFVNNLTNEFIDRVKNKIKKGKLKVVV